MYIYIDIHVCVKDCNGYIWGYSWDIDGRYSQQKIFRTKLDMQCNSETVTAWYLINLSRGCGTILSVCARVSFFGNSKSTSTRMEKCNMTIHRRFEISFPHCCDIHLERLNWAFSTYSAWMDTTRSGTVFDCFAMKWGTAGQYWLSSFVWSVFCSILTYISWHLNLWEAFETIANHGSFRRHMKILRPFRMKRVLRKGVETRLPAGFFFPQRWKSGTISPQDQWENHSKLEVVNHVSSKLFEVLLGHNWGIFHHHWRIFIRFVPTSAELYIFSWLAPCWIWWLRLSWCPLEEWTQ